MRMIAQHVTEAGGQLAMGSDAFAACIEHCLSTAESIDRNVHQTNLIEYWADALAEIYQTGRTPVRYSP